ncbi:MAG: hypothetical protein KC501_22195, partial [Myxococcales bacterium]|nr:hypothetical protein [Myxococcales bacterium]
RQPGHALHDETRRPLSRCTRTNARANSPAKKQQLVVIQLGICGLYPDRIAAITSAAHIDAARSNATSGAEHRA